MPEGIIRDPKQNPAEEKVFGIVQELASPHRFFYYRKTKGNKSRGCIAGDIIEFTNPHMEKTEDPDLHVSIEGTVNFNKVKTNDDNAIMINRITTNNGGPQGIEQILDRLIAEGKIKSPFKE